MEYFEMCWDFLDHWFASVDKGGTVDYFLDEYMPYDVKHF